MSFFPLYTPSVVACETGIKNIVEILCGATRQMSDVRYGVSNQCDWAPKVNFILVLRTRFLPVFSSR